jgi:hypothetical protein
MPKESEFPLAGAGIPKYTLNESQTRQRGRRFCVTGLEVRGPGFLAFERQGDKRLGS